MLKINSIIELLDLIRSLVLSGYKVNVKAIYDKYPYENKIKYFKVDYEK